MVTLLGQEKSPQFFLQKELIKRKRKRQKRRRKYLKNANMETVLHSPQKVGGGQGAGFVGVHAVGVGDVHNGFWG